MKKKQNLEDSDPSKVKPSPEETKEETQEETSKDEDKKKLEEGTQKKEPVGEPHPELDEDDASVETPETKEEPKETEESKEETKESKEETKKTDTDYKKRYADSSREAQKLKEQLDSFDTWKPVIDLISKDEDIREVIQSRLGESQPSGEETGEVESDKFQKLEETVKGLKSQREAETRERVDKSVAQFKKATKISDADYDDKVRPLLLGIGQMKNPKTGNSYSLKEALEMAYFISNRDQFEGDSEEKSKDKLPPEVSTVKEQPKKENYTEEQESMAKRLGVTLD